MAGEAKTNAFMLAAATVMIGPQSDLWTLNPAAHSIGLVKNFLVDAAPAYVELTQGVKNTIVYSVLNANPVKCTAEVYEYTAKNLAYGLGLDGSTIDTISTSLVTNADLVGDGATNAAFTIHSTSDIHTDFVAGQWVMVQELGGTDQVMLGKVVTSAWSTPTLTVTLDRPAPDAVTWHSGSLISVINRINVGSKADQPFLSAKIVGILPQGNEPLVVVVPKMRVTKGFSLGFHTDQFQNLPFEFTPYELVSTDPNYTDFANLGPVAIFDRQ